MLRLTTVLLATFLIFSLAVGCSSQNQNPAVPTDSQSELSSLFPDVDPGDTNRSLVGKWTVNFDTDALTASVQPYRDVQDSGHMNITGLLPMVISVNSFDPLTGIVDIDIEISNPSPNVGYDLRLIVYTDNVGHRLMNADDWTALWDIQGGMPINPFMAYAKEETARIFLPFSSHSENLKIYLPGNDTNITFGMDVSFPENCEEPYKIDSFHHELLFDYEGSRAEAFVHVYDWQDDEPIYMDTHFVALYCPMITGSFFVSFKHHDSVVWKANIVNDTGAPAGMYTGYIAAGSYSSGMLFLYDSVNILVSEGGGVPDDPIEIGWCEINGAYSVVVDGNLAYVACRNYGLKCVDITDLENPFIKAELDITTEVYDLDIQGDYAYLATYALSYNGKLIIVDISHPEAMAITSSINVGEPYAIDVEGDFAYLVGEKCCWTGHLWVYNISNPNEPLHVGNLETDASNNQPHDISIVGDLAYIADRSAGIFIADISNPSSPEFEGSGDTNGDTLEVAIQGNYAYLADGGGGIKIFDISDPANPTMTGSFQNHPESAIAVDGNFAYCIDSNFGLRIYDIENPIDPYYRNGIDLPYSAKDITLLGNYALIPSGNSGLRIFQLW